MLQATTKLGNSSYRAYSIWLIYKRVLVLARYEEVGFPGAVDKEGDGTHGSHKHCLAQLEVALPQSTSSIRLRIRHVEMITELHDQGTSAMVDQGVS